MTNLGIEFIPRIWVDTLNASLRRQMILGWDYTVKEMEEHKRRMETDPDYALAQAELEAWSYWDALYENQRVYEEEEDW